MENHPVFRITHNPCVHYLWEGQVYPYDEKEFLLRDIESLPIDFMDMTLFDLDGKGGVYVFSRIVDYQEGVLVRKGAVYRQVELE